jgi:hypothetical protein
VTVATIGGQPSDTPYPDHYTATARTTITIRDFWGKPVYRITVLDGDGDVRAVARVLAGVVGTELADEVTPAG